ncbi:MAG: hypothetical protein LBC53_01190, partial [Spirochaetaceae bacterium]|nr:hypothetical protein [Spirochaetaceae bacterium]
SWIEDADKDGFSGELSLSPGGSAVVLIKVLTFDGKTGVYYIPVNRAEDDSATLSALTVSGSGGTAAWSPAFSPNDASALNYTAAFPVNASISSQNITITSTAASSAAKVEFVGETGHQFTLAPGGQKMAVIRVTAQNGSYLDYNITVIWEADARATLSTLTVSGSGGTAVWTPAFSPNNASALNYTAAFPVNASISSQTITITSTAASSAAKVEFVGETGYQFSLAPGGQKTAVIRVTAQNGFYLDYRISVTWAGTTANQLTALTVSGTNCNWNSSFKANTYSYNVYHTGTALTIGTVTGPSGATVEYSQNGGTYTTTKPASVSTPNMSSSTLTIRVKPQTGEPRVYTLIITRYQKEWVFYGGAMHTWTVPYPGKYKFEAWGGSGGNADQNSNQVPNSGAGAAGGYSSGSISNLPVNTTLYVYAGGRGEDSAQYSRGGSGGFNGGGTGGHGTTVYQGGGGGGGATDFRFTSAYNTRILVAGGGGGGGHHSKAGTGGGATGGNAINYNNNTITGAGQTSGYAFGYGQTGGISGTDSYGSDGHGGGGGGYYGGKAKGDGGTDGAGAGGSGFVYGYSDTPGINKTDDDKWVGNGSYSSYKFTGDFACVGGGGNGNSKPASNSGGGMARITFTPNAP